MYLPSAPWMAALHGAHQGQQKVMDCAALHPTYHHRVDDPDAYNFCPVPETGYDVILFAGMAVAFAACLIWNQYRSLLVMLAGGALAGLVLPVNTGRLGNAVAWWLGIKPYELFFYVFLPPLLLDAAVRIEFYAFKKMIVPVLGLAFAVVAGTAGLIIPIFLYAFRLESLGWNWACAALYGAMVGPTDAVAIINAMKISGGPTRLRVILEGEALLNDASSITLFHIFFNQVQMYMTSSLPGQTAVHLVWTIVKQALRLTAGGIAVGLIAGVIMQFALQLIRFGRASHEQQVALSLAAGYLAFYVAENPMHTSGVVAVVVFGLYGAYTHKWGMSRKTEAAGAFSAFWDTVCFAMNNIVFFYAGISCINFFWRSISVLKLAGNLIILESVGILLGGYAAVFLLRLLLIMVVNLFHMVGKNKNPLNWREMLFLTLGGVRGAVTLIMAQAVVNGIQPDDKKLSRVKAEIALSTAGFVLLTLVFNGTIITPLLGWLRLNDVPPFVQNRRRNAIKKLIKAADYTMKELRNIMQDKLTLGADWNAVDRHSGPAMLRTKLQSFISSSPIDSATNWSTCSDAMSRQNSFPHKNGSMPPESPHQLRNRPQVSRPPVKSSSALNLAAGAREKIIPVVVSTGITDAVAPLAKIAAEYNHHVIPGEMATPIKTESDGKNRDNAASSDLNKPEVASTAVAEAYLGLDRLLEPQSENNSSETNASEIEPRPVPISLARLGRSNTTVTELYPDAWSQQTVVQHMGRQEDEQLLHAVDGRQGRAAAGTVMQRIHKFQHPTTEDAFHLPLSRESSFVLSRSQNVTGSESRRQTEEVQVDAHHHAINLSAMKDSFSYSPRKLHKQDGQHSPSGSSPRELSRSTTPRKLDSSIDKRHTTSSIPEVLSPRQLSRSSTGPFRPSGLQHDLSINVYSTPPHSPNRPSHRTSADDFPPNKPVVPLLKLPSNLARVSGTHLRADPTSTDQQTMPDGKQSSDIWKSGHEPIDVLSGAGSPQSVRRTTSSTPVIRASLEHLDSRTQPFLSGGTHDSDSDTHSVSCGVVPASEQHLQQLAGQGGVDDLVEQSVHWSSDAAEWPLAEVSVDQPVERHLSHGSADTVDEYIQRVEEHGDIRCTIASALLQQCKHKRLLGLLSSTGVRVAQTACEVALEHPSSPLKLWSVMEKESNRFMVGLWEPLASITGGSMLEASNKRLLRRQASRKLSKLMLWWRSLLARMNRLALDQLTKTYLLKSEIAIEYVLAMNKLSSTLRITNSPVWKIEVQQDLATAVKFLDDFEAAAPERFSAIQTYRVMLAMLQKEQDFLKEMLQDGTVDDEEHDMISVVLNKVELRLENDGLRWQEPDPWQVVIRMPFFKGATDSIFRLLEEKYQVVDIDASWHHDPLKDDCINIVCKGLVKITYRDNRWPADSGHVCANQGNRLSIKMGAGSCYHTWSALGLDSWNQEFSIESITPMEFHGGWHTVVAKIDRGTIDWIIQNASHERGYKSVTRDLFRFACMFYLQLAKERLHASWKDKAKRILDVTMSRSPSAPSQHEPTPEESDVDEDADSMAIVESLEMALERSIGFSRLVQLQQNHVFPLTAHMFLIKGSLEQISAVGTMPWEQETTWQVHRVTQRGSELFTEHKVEVVEGEAEPLTDLGSSPHGKGKHGELYHAPAVLPAWHLVLAQVDREHRLDLEYVEYQLQVVSKEALLLYMEHPSTS